MTPAEATTLAAILAEKGWPLVPSADLDRLRAVERAIEDEWQRSYQQGYAPTEAETAVTDVLARIRAALGDRAAEHDRQSAAGTHLYDESCLLCGDRAAEEGRPLDEATDCGCVHGADEHYLGCLTCERYGRNHAALGDRAAEEGR